MDIVQARWGYLEYWDTIHRSSVFFCSKTSIKTSPNGDESIKPWVPGTQCLPCETQTWNLSLDLSSYTCNITQKLQQLQRPVHQLRFFFAIIQWRILSKSPAGFRKRKPQRDRNQSPNLKECHLMTSNDVKLVLFFILDLHCIDTYIITWKLCNFKSTGIPHVYFPFLRQNQPHQLIGNRGKTDHHLVASYNVVLTS